MSAGRDHLDAAVWVVGFRRLGRAPDRFRVDEFVIHDVSMALRVGE